MGYKPVSVRQTEDLRKMANEKRIGHDPFQDAIRDGRIGRFLDTLKSSQEVIEINSGEILAPEDARLHMLRVRWTQDREWQEAVTAAGPNTPSHYDVRKVGDLYVPTGTGEIEEDFVLLNYADGSGNWDKALAWGEKNKLEKTVPRQVFAVGEKNPTLHTILGYNPMWLVATTPCAFGGDRRACHVWWRGAERGAYLYWAGGFHGRRDWFLFRKPVVKTKAL